MSTAQSVRLVGYGGYGAMVALGLFAFVKPQAFQVLLISSGLISLACLMLVVLGVRKAVPEPEKRWAPREGWVQYAMGAVALAQIALGVFTSALVPVVILVSAFVAGIQVANADKMGDDSWPPSYWH